MTIEEAIKRIRSHMRNHHIGEYPHIYIKEALDMAIAALQEKQDREKPMTNADRIRAMSDEELADFMNKEHDFCKNWPKCMEMLDHNELVPDNWCKKCLLAWLQKPVEDSPIPVRFHLDKQESGLLEED